MQQPGTCSRTVGLGFVAMLACVGSACAMPLDDQYDDMVSAEAEDADSTGPANDPTSPAYFRVSRDSALGGFWVASLDGPRTTCGDGAVADRCYVTYVSFRALGLDENGERALLAAFASGSVVVQGSFSRVDAPDGSYFKLVLSAAWIAAAQ